MITLEEKLKQFSDMIDEKVEQEITKNWLKNKRKCKHSWKKKNQE